MKECNEVMIVSCEGQCYCKLQPKAVADSEKGEKIFVASLLKG